MTDERTVLATDSKKAPKLFLLCQETISEVALMGHQVMGRPSSSSAPDIALAAASVSRSHGEFVVQSNGVYFRDTQSSNGTSLNGKRLEPNQAVLLADGDVLRVHAASDADCQMDAVLVFSTDYEDVKWETLDLTEVKAVNIGREQELMLESKEVSRNHASFFEAKQGWAVIDHESTNGVYVNGVRIQEAIYLKNTDIVRIGSYFFCYKNGKLIYQRDASVRQEMSAPTVLEPAAEPVCKEPVAESVAEEPVAAQTVQTTKPEGTGLSIDIVERSVWKRVRKKMLLKDIHLDIPLGSMVLILGGSGAGKTTFMNAVMGYEQAEGKITYNHTDIYEEFERMQYEIGYVPQQDLMRPNDIAYDTVLNAAQLKLEPGREDAYYENCAAHAMEVLGLADEKQQMVRSLSGGQRKRLSIAMEYVGNPSLFFLDEPDSGVDNTNSELLLKNLRSIADEGKIVLFISHSPDRTIDMIDKIIVLAKDSEHDCGRLVFYGDPHKALDFFEVENLNKIVTRINKKNEGGDGLADEYIAKFKEEGHLYG